MPSSFRCGRGANLAAFAVSGLLLLPAPPSTAEADTVAALVVDDEFAEWIESANCDDLKMEITANGTALAARKKNLRVWEMKIRSKLSSMHERYRDECISSTRIYTYRCELMNYNIAELNSALTDDSDNYNRNLYASLLAQQNVLRREFKDRCARGNGPVTVDGIDHHDSCG